MNESAIVEVMINFIGNKERELQSNKISVDSRIKNDVVKSVLEELERVTNNEN